MTDLFTIAKVVALALNGCGHPYAFCGGLAVGVYGHVRATVDVDVIVEGMTACQAAVDALVAEGLYANPDTIDFPDGLSLRRCLYIDASGETTPVDVLIAPEGGQVLENRLLSDIAGVACWVLGRQELIAMKRAANRPKDQEDLRHLEHDA